MKHPIYDDLFIFEIANNHEGSVELGLEIVDAMGDIADKYKLNAAVKLQYRDLDSFVHPDHKEDSDNKHIPRFLKNRLTADQFKKIIDRIKERGMKAIVTPFDEASVDTCIEHDVDVLKVASCSAADWPLLEAIADAGKPVIASTGGLKIYEIDDLVSYFTHRGTDLGLMHCVALYPTPNDKVRMNFMSRMIRRYPQVPVGYSGHEAPDNIDIVKSAIGKGAKMLERHVGITTSEKPELNAYSMLPDQTDEWVQAALKAKEIAGPDDERSATQEEDDSLLGLQRGVFAKKAIKNGEKLTRDDVFFAMPAQKGQLTSGEFGKYRTEYIATRDYAENEAIFEEPSAQDADHIKSMRTIIHDAKGILHEAGVQLGQDYSIEISHHHGIERFRKIGGLLINIVNREYCKKLVVMLPGQEHPTHKHIQKEETFHLLWGDLVVNLNGREVRLKAGDQLLVERGAWHSFYTEGGAIVEEVSTQAISGDSVYENPEIDRLDPTQRKTILEEW